MADLRAVLCLCSLCNREESITCENDPGLLRVKWVHILRHHDLAWLMLLFHVSSCQAPQGVWRITDGFSYFLNSTFVWWFDRLRLVISNLSHAFAIIVGNSYKMRAESHPKAVEWCRSLDMASRVMDRVSVCYFYSNLCLLLFMFLQQLLFLLCNSILLHGVANKTVLFWFLQNLWFLFTYFKNFFTFTIRNDWCNCY